MKKDETVVSVRIEAELYSRIKSVAAREDRTVSDQIRHWIKQGLSKEDPVNIEVKFGKSRVA